VVRRHHALDRGHEPTLAEVMRHRVALPTRMPPRVLEPLLRERPGGRLSPGDLGALTCPDVAMMVRLALRLDFVTAVPLALVRRELEEGTLVAIGHEPWMRTQYGLAWPKRARPPAAAAFAEILTQVDERFPDLVPPAGTGARRR
jgi:DNA-binding transcriptional LysR family regulator